MASSVASSAATSTTSSPTSGSIVCTTKWRAEVALSGLRRERGGRRWSRSQGWLPSARTLRPPIDVRVASIPGHSTGQTGHGRTGSAGLADHPSGSVSMRWPRYAGWRIRPSRSTRRTPPRTTSAGSTQRTPLIVFGSGLAERRPVAGVGLEQPLQARVSSAWSKPVPTEPANSSGPSGVAVGRGSPTSSPPKDPSRLPSPRRPAADHQLLLAADLHLAPRRRPPAGLVLRREALGHHPLEALLGGRLLQRRAVADLVGRHRPPVVRARRGRAAAAAGPRRGAASCRCRRGAAGRTRRRRPAVSAARRSASRRSATCMRDWSRPKSVRCAVEGHDLAVEHDPVAARGGRPDPPSRGSGRSRRGRACSPPRMPSSMPLDRPASRPT